jgi:AbrB family looped-hinge helix DNA binding protein
MQEKAKITKKMRVFTKGQVVIPVNIRRIYNIDIGDQIEFITVQGGILLKPSKPKQTDRSLTDKLYGIFSDYAGESRLLDKDAINTTTEDGFTHGWNK